MTTPILAIDPGPECSSWVLWDPTAEQVLAGADQVANADLEIMLYSYENLTTGLRKLGLVERPEVRQLVVERPVVMGMQAVTAALMETSYWSGVFAGAWPGLVDRLTYHKVRCQLAGSKCKEPEVKQAIISRFAPNGHGKDGKGTKKAPGPFYGVTGHMWSAVAVAVAWGDLHGAK